MRRILTSAFCCLLFIGQTYSQTDGLAEKGIAAHQSGDTDQALKYFDQMLRECEASDDRNCVASSHRLMGESYRATGEFDLALQHLRSARNILLQTGNQTGLAQTYNRLGAVFFEYPDRDSARIYAHKSIEITQVLGDLEFTANNLNLLGALEREAGNYAKAIEHLEHSYELQSKLSDQDDIPNVLNNIAITYSMMNRSDKAIEYANRSLELSEVSGIHAYSDIACQVLSGAYKKKGDYKSALKYYEMHTQHHNAVFSAEKAKEIARINAEYDDYKIKQQNQLTQQENTLLRQNLALEEASSSRQRSINIGITVALILVVILAWVLFNGRRRLQLANIMLTGKNKEIREQKDQLEDLNRVKDHLFSIIGHDLKSPLNSLNGILQLLKSGDISPEEIRVITASLTDRLDYTTMLVDNLLNWARSQLEGFSMRPDRVSLTDLAMGQVRLLEPQAQHKGVKITKELDGHVVAYADRDMIELAIRNLLANAIKFTPKGGEINVKATADDEAVHLEVKDSGIGMNDEAIARILNKEFFSTRGTAKEKGTGLGLMLVRDFVERNGGQLDLESKEGEGSTFRITLPFKREKIAA